MSAICGSPTSRRAEQLIRLAEILERTPQEILRYFLDFLTGRSPQYRDAYELTYLFDSFPYSRRAKRRVRRKLAAMVRTEQAFPHPEHNERAARQIELGRTLK